MAFPMRLPTHRIAGAYRSPRHAFDAHDHFHVARCAGDDPELRGCALIMLGNRPGGERILDRHNVRTARACFHRAYAAWVVGDDGEAGRWIAETRRLPDRDDAALDRFSALIAKKAYRVLLHADFTPAERLVDYLAIPDIDVVLTSYRTAFGISQPVHIGETFTTAIPDGPPIDLVVVDDLKLFPLGVRELGAPVTVLTHDWE